MIKIILAATDPAADFLAGDLAQVPETPTADIEIEPQQASPESAPVGKEIESQILTQTPKSSIMRYVPY